MFSIDNKLLEEGKIELLKNTLNELEELSKSKEEFAVNKMKKIIEQYSHIKHVGPKIDLNEYDKRLNQIVLSSDKRHLFY